MRLVLGLLLAGFLLWTASTAITLVQPGERAVVRRFGRLLDHKPQPGLHVGLPWGIDRVDRVPIGQVRRVVVGFSAPSEKDEEETPPGQLLTGDHNLVNVEVEVFYTIREEQVEKFVLKQDVADPLVERVAEAALARWLAGRPVDGRPQDAVLLRGQALLPPYLREEIQDRLEPYDLGIAIEEAVVRRLYAPEEVKDAFDEVSQAQAGMKTRLNQAEQVARRRFLEAQGEEFRMLSLAKAYAQEKTQEAQADADGFRRRLATYRTIAAAEPNYLDRLWLEEMTRIYSEMRRTGRIDLLDHHLSEGGLNITQFPLSGPRK